MHTDIARLFAKVWFGVTCATVSLAIACGAAAAAGVVVMESSVTGLDRGQELADDQSLNIPAGSHLLVGVVQGAQLKQVDIVGPRAGSVKDLLNPEPTSSALWKILTRLVQSGGANERGFGATRGIRPVAPLRLVVNGLSVSGRVAICVENGISPTIGVASGSESVSVRLSEDMGTQSANLTLASTPVPWPAAVPLRDGNLYRINAQNSPDVVLEVHTVPVGTLRNLASVRALETLAARGCERQVAAAFEKK